VPASMLSRKISLPCGLEKDTSEEGRTLLWKDMGIAPEDNDAEEEGASAVVAKCLCRQDRRKVAGERSIVANEVRGI
jgi:hypothetical protein